MELPERDELVHTRHDPRLIGMAASISTGILVQQAGTPRTAYMLFGSIVCFVLLPCALWLVTQQKRAAPSPIPEKITSESP